MTMGTGGSAGFTNNSALVQTIDIETKNNRNTAYDTTGAGMIFKGSGFYITDYRSEGYKQAAKKASSTAASTAAPEKKAGGETKAKSA